MPLDARLENYLSTLDRILRPVPASERADIVMEIKSHVLSALERDPQASTESILRALGEPETVANRYLLERGLKPAKPPISPVVKWIVLGGLGCLALSVAALVALAFFFSPLLKVSEDEGKVVLLGGLIDIDEGKGKVKIGDAEFSGGENKHFEGEASVASGGKVAILLSNGRLAFTTAAGPKLRWDCHSHEDDAAPELTVQNGVQVLDMKNLRGARCEIAVPKASPLNAEADNGRISFEQPLYDVTAKLDNGRISVAAAKGTRYAYDFKIGNGRADEATSDPAPEYRIRAEVGNGKISVE
jgi:hypothetical protein